MSLFDNLIGLEYDTGRVDCFSCVRDYYAQVWDLHIPNFARPNQFWEDPNLDLYAMYKDVGFKILIDQDPEIGDALLMQLATPRPAHAAVVVGDNQILHHLPRRLSGIDRLRPHWYNRSVVMLYHPEVRAKKEAGKEKVNFHDIVDIPFFRDPRFQDSLTQTQPLGSGS